MPAPCHHLPLPARPLTAASIHEVGSDRGPRFYLLALECAHSRWLAGLPAQSLLLLNRAFAAELQGEEQVLAEWPLPYRAAAWVMRSRTAEQFIGNPRRHFQHLATRMVEPRKELRTWRAWACWALARAIFPDDPADDKQLAAEGVIEPAHQAISARLDQLGLPNETRWWQEALADAGSGLLIDTCRTPRR